MSSVVGDSQISLKLIPFSSNTVKLAVSDSELYFARCCTSLLYCAEMDWNIRNGKQS